APAAASGGLFAQAQTSAGAAGGFPPTKYPMTGGATMSAEPYAPATGPGAGSAALAMAQPEPQMERAAERVPEARAEADSFIAPRPAEPEVGAEGGGGMDGFLAEPDPFAEAALANAARREAPRQEMAAPSRPAPQPTQPAMERPAMEHLEQPRREVSAPRR